ncbi:MAG: SHOCT domain-containing protein [Treponema sp.]|nr:SHOCT domain-containing protein [Treponema sp.]
MSQLLKTIQVPQEAIARSITPAVIEIYNDHVTGKGGVNGGGEWFYDDYTDVVIKWATLNCAFPSILFLDVINRHHTDATTMSVIHDKTRILFEHLRVGVLGSSKKRDEKQKAENFIISLREEIKSAFETYKSTSSQTKTTANRGDGNSSADELKKYKELLDTGIITLEEFDAKKKQLLGL